MNGNRSGAAPLRLDAHVGASGRADPGRPAASAPHRPPVSIAICTRNRGPLVREAVLGVLAGTYHEIEVFVIDQSDDALTEEAVMGIEDPRLQYIRTHTRGLSEARNVALRMNASPLLAFTDDDCVPAPDWVETLVTASARVAGPAIFFGPLVADGGASQAGMIPSWAPTRPGVSRRPLRDYALGGFGGNMAINAAGIALAGTFSPRLGRGARLTACEEGEFAFRLALRGGTVHELCEGVVYHRGAVPWDSVSEALRNDYGSTGHVLGWYIRRLRLAAVTQLGYCLGRELRLVARNAVSGRRPLGARRPIWLVRGLVRGLRDRTELVPQANAKETLRD